MRKLEREIEKTCVEEAEILDWMHGKLEKIGRGWPDHIFFGPFGKVLIVEFKRPKLGPRSQQAARHRELAALGHRVHVVTSVSQFLELLAR